jgi:hypothetical protein
VLKPLEVLELVCDGGVMDDKVDVHAVRDESVCKVLGVNGTGVLRYGVGVENRGKDIVFISTVVVFSSSSNPDVGLCDVGLRREESGIGNLKADEDVDGARESGIVKSISGVDARGEDRDV